jgi:sulfatase modifying factor 1
MIFNPPKHAVDLHNSKQWWSFKLGANLEAVVQTGQFGQRAPRSSRRPGRLGLREIGWQGLADRSGMGERGGLDDAEFAWGDELNPRGRQIANTWQGAFSHQNLQPDGYGRTSPVTAFSITVHHEPASRSARTGYC